MRSNRADEGTAAVELALCLLAMFALVALCAPLGVLLVTQTRLERAAGVAARFATQVPDRARPGVAAIKPTDAEVIAAAVSAAQSAGIDTGSASWSTPVISRTNGNAPASVVTVKLTKSVSMSGFAGILSFVGIVPAAVTINATAVGRQE